MSKYLVTGGAGFIGSHLVDNLLNSGNEVVVVDNFNNFYNPQQKEKNLAAHKGNPNFHLYKIDFSNFAELEKVFQNHKFDGIFHIGARAGVRRSWDEVEDYFASNILGTRNIFEAAKKYAVHVIVYASSSTAYGSNAPLPFKEDAAFEHQMPPASPYGLTKRATENIAAMYADLYGIKSIGLRLFSVYGERIRHDLAPWLFADAITKNKPIQILGNLESKRDFTYVGDVVNAFIKSMEVVPNIKHEVFNVGNDRPVALGKLIELIENNLGKKANIIYKEQHESDPRETRADLQKSKQMLAYSPKVNLEEGIERMIKWFKENNA